MTEKPIIGIIQCNKLAKYADAIQQAGGDVQPLPHVDTPWEIAEQVNQCDGILLPGGADFVPSDNKHSLASQEVQSHYNGLIYATMATKKPLLGICLGFQAIALKHYCPFIADMETCGDEGIHNHKKNKTGDYDHEIVIPVGSPLRSIFLKDKILVNCNHHQAIRELCKPFIPAAYSLGDNIIEAGCLPNLDEHFVVGIQW
ncbi:MAG: gamma-glutamyl-gamma-aminobutyrate hydrolase family protein, partial [Victivallales bacterium]|nr:gamma-glutamyl-gamma-aminobutyrate hydrolase family protein [Victivallales bacterium]